MITDKTVGALVSNGIFQRYANAGGEIDIQALIDAAQAGSPLISNLTQTELWEVMGIFGYSGEENTSITSLVYNPITTTEGLDIEAQFVGVLSFVAPNLVSVGDDGFIFLEFPNVQTILFPVLQHCKFFTVKGSGTSPVTSLDLSLLSVTTQLVVSRFPNLTTISLNDAIYTAGVDINFQDNALSAAMVNSVIASVKSSGIDSCVVNLTQGTTSPPIGQGITDYKYLLLNKPNAVINVNWTNYSGTSDADFLAASGSFGTVTMDDDAYVTPTNALIQNIFNGFHINSANATSLTMSGLVFVLNQWVISTCPLLTSVSSANLATIIGGPLAIDNSGNGGAGLGTVTFPALTRVEGNITLSSSKITAFNLHNLTYCRGLEIHDNTGLTSVDFTSLVTADTNGVLFAIHDEASIVSISFPALTTITNGNVAFGGNSSLTTVSFPNVIFTNNNPNIVFSFNALNASSVNHILARCVASGVTATTIELNGGTNAAPTGQGITDKATLISAGNTVLTN